MTLAPMLEKSMGELDFTGSATALHNRIRGLNPWPCAWTTVGGKRLKVLRSVVAERLGRQGKPGEVLSHPGGEFVVACGQGALVLPFLLSFASFSVIGQLAACFGQHPPALGLLLRARLLHGVFTALLATPVLWAQFAAAPAMTGQPVLAPGSGALLGALCLMAMVTILASAVEGNH